MTKRITTQRLVFLAGTTLLTLLTAPAQQPSEGTPPATKKQSAAQTADRPATAASVRSVAERIVSLQRLIEMDKERLAELEANGKEISGQFDRLSKQFSRHDQELADARRRLEEARLKGGGANLTDLEIEVEDHQGRWTETRKEFDLVIQRRKAIERQIKTLPEKIKLEQQGLKSLTGGGSAEPNAVESSETPAAGISAAASGTGPTAMEAPLVSGPNNTEQAFDPVVAGGRKALVSAEQEQRAAEERVQLLNRGIDLFQADVDNTEELLSSERSKAQADQEKFEKLQNALDAVATGSARSVVARMQKQVDESRQQLELSQQSVIRYADRLELINLQLSQLQDAYDGAVQALNVVRNNVEEARARLEFLQSPLAPHKLTRWVQREGVVILIILALMGLLWMLAQVIARRVVMVVVRRSHRGADYEREQRAQTLKRIFQSVSGILILTLGSLAVLDQVGIDVTLLLGGAAVFGMAVAFGAQALVKDYFSGIIMLMENQYSVGNVVRIGEVAGAVEDVTLRMTVLRDLEGVAHFIPHGQVTTVSNLTHGWSRVVFDIGVGYGENVDEVMKVLARLASELQNDKEFGPLILDEPEMLGVDALGDSAVVIKFTIKTRPLRQWVVKRELLRRIKHEFDALGIEIPFPHRTVYHRDFSDKLVVEVDDRQVFEPVSNTAGDAAISR